MTSLELLLALADEETLEFARRMIGKPRLALLLAKAAARPNRMATGAGGRGYLDGKGVRATHVNSRNDIGVGRCAHASPQ